MPALPSADPTRPIYTDLPHLPGTRVTDCHVRHSIITEGCYLDRCEITESIVGLRTHIQAGSRITRSVLLGADFYDNAPAFEGRPAMGIGRDVVLDRVIIDKNARIGDRARLVNEAKIEEADGEGYYIRGGIIVVPKGGVIPPGTVV